MGSLSETLGSLRSGSGQKTISSLRIESDKRGVESIGQRHISSLRAEHLDAEKRDAESAEQFKSTQRSLSSLRAEDASHASQRNAAKRHKDSQKQNTSSSNESSDSTLSNLHRRSMRLLGLLVELPEPSDSGCFRWRVQAQRLEQSWQFRFFINGAIFASAIQMGIQAEQGEDTGDDESRAWSQFFEHVFTASFAAEMVVKLYVQACTYFMDTWNLLDFGVVWVSVFYAWILPPLNLGSSENGGVVRIFRLLRLLRVIKVTKSIPDLRMVVEGLAASLRALFWVAMLLLMVLYIFAIVCVEMVGSKTEMYPGFNATQGVIESQFASFNSYEFFGSIPRAMMSLLSISLLAEWTSFRPIWEYQPWFSFVLIGLIFLVTIGLMNVIVGVIVEHTTSSMNTIKFQVEQDEKLRRLEDVNAMAGHFWKSDADRDGIISRKEMRVAANDHEFLALFAAMDLPKGFTVDDLFDLLNIDGMEGLKSKEFIDGMHRMIFSTEFQKTCLMMLGMGQVKQVHKEMIKSHEQWVKAALSSLETKIDALHVAIRQQAPFKEATCRNTTSGVVQSEYPKVPDGPFPSAMWLRAPAGDAEPVLAEPTEPVIWRQATGEETAGGDLVAAAACIQATVNSRRGAGASCPAPAWSGPSDVQL